MGIFFKNYYNLPCFKFYFIHSFANSKQFGRSSVHSTTETKVIRGLKVALNPRTSRHF